MTPSIRTFLLINLFLSVTLITSLSIIGNLALSHKDIQKQLDIQLVHLTVAVGALFSSQLAKSDINSIRASFRQTDVNYTNILASLPPETSKEILGPDDLGFFVEMQIWSANHQLLLSTPGAPTTPFADGKQGFSNVAIDNHTWRVYTLPNPAQNYTLMVAQHLDYRQTLESRLTQDSIYILLLSYPFLALLIWLIVGKALHILKRVAQEVSHRAPSYLEPFDLAAVPKEIVPLVAALNHLFGRLRDAFEREKRFTGDAAHELKTPLAAISVQAQAALRCNRESSREFLVKILEGVNRSNHVIQQLLTLSRMVPEATIHDFTEVTLARETTDVAATLAPEAIQKNIDLELLTPDSKATIYGNPTAIGILIRNLIDNAIRYTPKGGWVKIAIRETTNEVILVITDNGPGIPVELRERVFERFYRIVGNESPGSGLGLGIVQQIAKLHGAKVTLLTPESGVGLEVQVAFPRMHRHRKEGKANRSK